MFTMYLKEKRQTKRWLRQTTKYLKTIFPNLKKISFHEEVEDRSYCNYIEILTKTGSSSWINTDGKIYIKNRKEYLSDIMDFLWKIKEIEGERND
jgi:hypothetical protein